MKQWNFTLFLSDGFPKTSQTNEDIKRKPFKDKLVSLKMLLVFFISCTFFTQAYAQPYCAMACHNQVNVSLSQSCEVEVTYAMMMPDPNNPYLCSPNGPQAYMISIDYPAGTNTYNPANIIDGSHAGHNLTVTVKHWATGNTCWGMLFVEDKNPPSISCPADLTISCTDAVPSANISNSNISDCSTYTQSHSDNVIDLGCSGTYTSQIIRTHTVQDSYGNATTCTQNIFVVRATVADVEDPHDYDGNDYPVLSCGTQYDPSVVPGPTINGQPIVNGQTCDLALTHTDQVVDLCGGSKKIIRLWTVADWCTGQVITVPQLIKLMDQTPPTIVCPTSFSFGSNSTECTGSVVLPPATVSDNCSNPVDVVITTSVGTIDGNGGYLSDLPFGNQAVTYTATDACGNVSSCTVNVEVQDNTSPIPVCDQNTVLSITNGPNGTTQVCYQTFDDGSYDNCGIAVREIRRMDAPNTVPFDDCILLDCSDVGNTVMVIFKVTDHAGNYNQCMVEVEVQDKTNPTISCPPDVTLQCDEDFADLNLTYEATTLDNCGASVTFQDLQNTINDCGIGSVKRRWTTTDANGNTTTCDQTIYLQNNLPFTENMINWPPDPPALSCVDASTLDPDDLQAPFAFPTFSGDVCDQVLKGHEDKILYSQQGTCFEIIREWKVIDWCQYDPNSSSPIGIWYHTQTIRVTDNEAPVIDGPADIIINSTANNCSSGAVTIPVVTATDCNPDVEITNNSPYASSGGADASGNYPFGVTTVTYSASDGCGNVSTHEVEIKITDGKQPTPVCIFVATDIMATGEVEIWASDLESGSSFDNCTAYADLDFRIRIHNPDVPPSTTPPTTTGVTFDCSHLGNVQVEVWVGDENNNWDYCLTAVNVQDNFNSCSGNNGGGGGNPQQNEYYIAGDVVNEENDEVENVEMNISSGSTMEMTGSDGTYMFPNLTQGANYTVTPEKDSNHGNGISTFDLIIMQKHILGIQQMTSPYKQIAADVNKSQTISTVDIVELRRLILNQITEFTNNTSWRFVDKDYVFAPGVSPLTATFPEVFSLNSLTADETDADFIAIKVGDLNCSASPNNMLGSVSRNNNTISLGMNTTTLSEDQVEVSFTAKDFKEMLGYQFALSFDTESLEFVDVVNGSLTELATNNFGFSLLNNGIITTSWSTSKSIGMEDGEVLFSLVFNKLKNNANTTLEVASNIVQAEAYRQNGETIEPMDVVMVTENSNTTTEFLSNTTFKLYQNQPNPFNNETVIGFELPDATSASIKIYDMSGRVLKVINGNYAAGYNEIKISTAEIDATGVIYYQLETSSDTATNKMIILR